jgi:uncharacterized protein YgiM (DUF1202 family)
MNTRFRKLAVALAMASWSAATFAGVMNVQSEKAVVRATPGPFAATVATLAYGDQVTTLAEQGAWTQVKTSAGVTGWTQTASLTKKTIKLQAGGKNVGSTASGEELALAGKGFNSQVEGEFKAKNPNMDFKAIDRMEQFKVGEKEMVRFIQEGGLTVVGKGGGK